jgi:hypothetical protein
MSDPNAQFGIFWYAAPTGGTLPYTVKWQINSYIPQRAGAQNYYFTDPNNGSGTWVDLPYTTTALTLPVVPPGFTSCIYAMTPPNMLTIQVSANSHNQQVGATVRAVYTNSAGVAPTNWCFLLAADRTGSFFSDPTTNQQSYYANITNDPVWADGYYS